MAEMQEADLNWADLKGASLASAQLQGATMIGIDLQGADSTRAQLQGADLSGAKLQGADLTSSNLNAAALREAHLAQAELEDVMIDAADMRRLRMTPISEPDRLLVLSALARTTPDRLQRFRARMAETVAPFAAQSVQTAVLVEEPDVHAPPFDRLGSTGKLLVAVPYSAQPDQAAKTYAEALVQYARADPAVAAGLAQRAAAIAATRDDRDRAAYVALVCRLLRSVETHEVQFSAAQIEKLKISRRACR
jgi:hypothetical protein